MRSINLHIPCLLWIIAVTSCGVNNRQTDVNSPSEYILVDTTSVVDANNRSEHIYGNIYGSKIATKIAFKPYQGNERHWLGTDGAIPELVIDSFEVKLNGKKVHIPHKLYGDFSDFFISKGSLRLYQTNRGYRVLYLGSDGAGSYYANFFFDAFGLYRMNVSVKGIGEDNMVQMIHSNRYTRKNEAEQGADDQLPARTESRESCQFNHQPQSWSALSAGSDIALTFCKIRCISPSTAPFFLH